jgi:signal transduction histidine kinase
MTGRSKTSRRRTPEPQKKGAPGGSKKRSRITATRHPEVLLSSKPVSAGHSRLPPKEDLQYFEAILDALHESLLILDSDLRVVAANTAFSESFALSRSQTVGKHLYLIGDGQWDISPLRELLSGVRLRGTEIANLQLDHNFSAVGQRILLLNARRFNRNPGDSPLILLAIQDETPHRRARNMPAQLLRIQDEERRRFARELHDSTSQSLAALTMNMNRLASGVPCSDSDFRALLAESQELAQTSIKEIRTVTYMLHPPLLDEAGLSTAIRVYSTGFSMRSGIHIELQIPEEAPRLPREMELALFRICQECLNNIHRHSGSDSAHIELAVSVQKVVLSVSDKGKGMGTDLINHNGDAIGGFSVGVGISSMQERTRQHGGVLEINSSPAGASIRAILPLPQS